MKKLIILFILIVSPDLYAGICGYEEMKQVSFIREGRKIVKFNTGLADTNHRRSRGLMYCTSFQKGKGLLFVFDKKGPKSFWMKNTMIPLGIIFISDDMRVLSVQYGVPFSLDHIDDNGPVRYVLEVNPDEARKINTEDVVIITPKR